MPILIAAGVSADIDPLLWMLPAALSASCAFMLPVATKTNAIVFATGQIDDQADGSNGIDFELYWCCYHLNLDAVDFAFVDQIIQYITNRDILQSDLR